MEAVGGGVESGIPLQVPLTHSILGGLKTLTFICDYLQIKVQNTAGSG